MGTNYYTTPKPPCECCGRPFERLHIGKSSAGWTFHFASYPEMGLTSWKSWRKYLSDFDTEIVDEYDRGVAFKEFVGRVESSQGNDKHANDKVDAEGYSISDSWDFT